MSSDCSLGLKATDAPPKLLWRSPERILKVLDYAIQPIADIGTGVVYGYEAQVRNCGLAGANTPEALIDHAHDHGFLAQLETELLRKALGRFSSFRTAQGTKLFFKLDGRDLGTENDPRMHLGTMLPDFGLEKSQVCLEFSERHQQTFTDVAHHAINDLRQMGFMVALDDFGRGSSELRLLHDMSPDYVKIDRFFLNGIDCDPRRKLFVTTVANLAHVLGARVIAEGVETEREFKACREAGCDLVQGYYVAKPFEEKRSAKLFYDHIRAPGIGGAARREKDRIRGELLDLPTIQYDASMINLLDLFVQNQDASLIPVLDANREPRGLIHERDLKAYLYAGGPDDEDAKAALDFPLRSFVRACPVADIDSNADMLLVTFASSINSDGIILTENFRYAGFLSATSLLKIIHEKRLQEAQDQNPLTGLPGNGAVSRFITDSAGKAAQERHLCYFDFDNFKPFNDTYGYRQGDRAIILFSELLQRHISGSGTFHGHIGGDDFFAGFINMDQTDIAARLLALQRAFRLDVESFYEAEHRSRGYIEAQDRFGTLRKFPMLQCSMSIVTVPRGVSVNPDRLNDEIIAMKRAAKSSDDGLVVTTLEHLPV
ncbi:EAL domain-containing protein [Roseibium denhamense]|uniref:Diguanylate cyclase/phosphodiesterase n=1 Tax=Roseibium denhamense TaxID=76305 RepID=A0ABY1N754_9HYPH|nr:EAL domain-containing protein [Roseibium denhamense]MTI05998.1 EAL domain-containing protein [Roseibium denhamense]SMP02235.1 diguanylate cyclase/phosphodiesterase [Roseibium denhamense]